MKYRSPLLNESEEAEKAIIRLVQQELFHEEISTLNEGMAVKRNSTVIKLNPFLSNDLLYVSSRLTRAPLRCAFTI